MLVPGAAGRVVLTETALNVSSSSMHASCGTLSGPQPDANLELQNALNISSSPAHLGTLIGSQPVVSLESQDWTLVMVIQS